MQRFTCSKLAALTAMWRAPLALGGDDSAKVVDVLFGDKLKAVQATPSRADDVALAAEMMEATKGDTVTPAIRAALYEKASELAVRDAAGFATAMQAIKDWPAEGSAAQRVAAGERQVEMLSRIMQAGRPAERAAAGGMLIDLLIRRGDDHMAATQYADAVATYRKAATLAPRAKPDEVASIKTRLELAVYHERLGRSIDQLKTKLLENRTDSASAEALVRLLLIDNQDAGAAATYLDAVKDAALKQVTALAAKPADQWTAAEALVLADWFNEAGKSAQGPALASALAQARRGYECVLQHKDAQNLAKTRAALQIKDLDARLAKLGATTLVRITEKKPLEPAKPGESEKSDKQKPIDLLAILDPEEHAIDTPWRIVDGKLLNPATDRRTRIAFPVSPQGDFILAARFTRLTGDESVSFLIPVGNTQIVCAIDSAPSWGSWAGIEVIDGKGIHENPSGVKGKQLTNGKSHTVAIEVRHAEDKVTIAMELDGKPLTKWTGLKSSLSANRIWQTRDTREIVIGMAASEYSFHSVQLRMKSGEAQPTRAPKE